MFHIERKDENTSAAQTQLKYASVTFFLQEWNENVINCHCALHRPQEELTLNYCGKISVNRFNKPQYAIVRSYEAHIWISRRTSIALPFLYLTSVFSNFLSNESRLQILLSIACSRPFIILIPPVFLRCCQFQQPSYVSDCFFASLHIRYFLVIVFLSCLLSAWLYPIYFSSGNPIIIGHVFLRFQNPLHSYNTSRNIPLVP